MGESIKPGTGAGSSDDKKAGADAASSPDTTQVTKGGAKRASIATNSQPDQVDPPVVDTVQSVQELEPSRANVGTQKLDEAVVYRVAEGYSITSPRGMLSGGEVVTPKDFGGSQERIDELVAAKTLVKGGGPAVPPADSAPGPTPPAATK